MTSWRKDPRLSGRLHPDHPDDLQVVVHDGGPRTTTRSPELLWVRVTGMRPDAFVGQALNQPHQLESLSLGGEVLFIVPVGWKFPLRVTEQYLAERPSWDIHPCTECGLAELFDPPTVLLQLLFPELPAGSVMQMFSALCGSCGGAQIVQARTDPET